MIIIFLLLSLYILKVYKVGSAFYIDDQSSFMNIILSDGFIVVLCLYFLFISTLVGSGFRFLIKLVISLLVVFYVSDLFVIFIFNSRLYFDDVFKFIFEIDFGMFNIYTIFLLLAVLFLVLMFLFSDGNYKIKSRKIFVFFIPLIFFLYNYNVNSSVRSVFFKNYILINVESTYDKEYSDKFKKSVGLKSDEIVCDNVTASRPKNIIVFIVESWSNYHSKWFGGDNDWTPKLDSLAKRGVSFKNFYANGFSTEGGLYSILTGSPLLPYKIKLGTDGALVLKNINFSESFPLEFSHLGYNTKFITSGDLSFLDKRNWLESLGFNKIIGNESFDKTERKFLFRSVSDENLYERVLNEINSDENNFIVVENVNTHQPFYYPEKNEVKTSEEYAFKYADEKLFNLINKVPKSNNMIIVMSDHRAMTPLSEKEISDSQQMASSRVPMFVIWNNEKKVIVQYYQQKDVLRSVYNSSVGELCHNHSTGAIFPLERSIPSKCVYHSRGDERSKVSVLCEDDKFDIILDGDDTRASADTKYTEQAINYINKVRLNTYKSN